MLPFKILFQSRRMLYTAIVSGLALIVIGLMILIVQARPITAHALSVVGGDGSKAVTVVPDAPIQEVHIANTGMMLLRGAKVFSVTPEVIRVSMKFGTSDFTWRIQNNSGTKFTSSQGFSEARAEIEVGDVITITGTLLENGVEPTIHAVYIRE